MIDKLADLIIRSRPPEGPMVVGVTGIDASGKSAMTAMLAGELIRSELPVQIIQIDDFHRPRAERQYGDLPEPDKYYENTFDFARLKTEILTPIRDEGSLDVSITCLDLVADTWSVDRHFVVKEESIVLIDGLFLFRPEMSHFLDLIVFLDVTESTVLERANSRDVPVHGLGIITKYETKYLPAQRKYLEDFPPETNADVIIDNNDWSNPIVIKWHEAD